MNPEFPLLRLPQLAQLEVFQECSPVNILNGSLTSSRMKCVIQSFRLRAIEHSVHFEKEYRIVTTFKKDDGLKEHLLIWQFVPEGTLDETTTREIQIGCHRFKKCATDGNYICAEYHNPEFGISVIFNHIFQLFHGPVDLFFKLKYVRNLHAILLNENFQKCRKLYVMDDFDTVYHHDLYKILDTLNIEKELEAYWRQDDLLDIDKITHLDNITVESGNRLTVSELCSLKCRTCTIKNHKFTEIDFFEFVSNWINSKDTNLESMRFGWEEDSKFESIIQNYNFTRWNRSVRSRFYYMRSESECSTRVDCSKGFDVTRPDGLTATILLQHNFECTLSFLVWHDPHPEFARLKQLDCLLSDEIKKFDNILGSRTTDTIDKEYAKEIKAILDDENYGVRSKTRYHLNKMSLSLRELYKPVVDKIDELKNEINLWKNGSDEDNSNDEVEGVWI